MMENGRAQQRPVSPPCGLSLDRSEGQLVNEDRPLLVAAGATANA
jgi:hypothetical protein